jgi:hypothetical protein
MTFECHMLDRIHSSPPATNLLITNYAKIMTVNGIAELIMDEISASPDFTFKIKLESTCG